MRDRLGCPPSPPSEVGDKGTGAEGRPPGLGPGRARPGRAGGGEEAGPGPPPPVVLVGGRGVRPPRLSGSLGLGGAADRSGGAELPLLQR